MDLKNTYPASDFQIGKIMIARRRKHRRRGKGSGASAPDAAPSALVVTGMRDTETDFQWTINSTNHDGHRVYISTDGVNYTEKGTTIGADNTYTATGLTAGVLYFFYVVAYKGSQESAATDIYDTRFKITVDTTKVGSANDTFILPTAGAGSYDYYVDWGDGGAESHVTANTSQTKVYAASGTYQLKIRGTFPQIYFNNAGDKAKLMTIDNWGNIAWSSMVGAFYGCANLTANYTDVPTTSACTSMQNMFRLCALFNGLVAFNTANVTSMAGMFLGCSVFNQSVSTFNTAKVTAFQNMFQDCLVFNQSVSNFNTAEALYTFSMFFNCRVFNQSVSNFNTAKDTNMAGMFSGCYAFNQSVANFNTANVTDMSNMFYTCFVFNQSVANFNTAKVTTMASMFQGAYIFNQSLAAWDVTKVTTMANMLNGNTEMSLANYDATLISWGAQAVTNTVTFHAGESNYTAGGDAETARAHLVLAVGSGGHGWTITDGGTPFDNGKVVITFDDQYTEAYSVIYPILNTQGIAATFYIRTDNVGQTGFCSWANLQTMAAGGMDLQCHTKDHADLRLLSQAQTTTNLTAVNDAFTANSLSAPAHIAYPQGFYNATVKTQVAGLRSTGRSMDLGFVRRASDKYALKTYTLNNGDKDTCKAAIDAALASKKAVLLSGHTIDTGTWNPMSADDFNEVIDYAQAQGLDIITVAQLYALMT
jgi:surface protein